MVYDFMKYANSSVFYRFVNTLKRADVLLINDRFIRRFEITDENTSYYLVYYQESSATAIRTVIREENLQLQDDCALISIEDENGISFRMKIQILCITNFYERDL